MAASQEQKLDYLLKKIGYTLSKTGIAEDSSLTGTKKAPFAESIPSPLIIPNESIWVQSSFIPNIPPTSSTQYVSIITLQMTVDSTVSGNRAYISFETYNDKDSNILGDWIGPQFGPDYVIKVYRGNPNTGGVRLSPSGTGLNDTWFFDYSSGILNFNGSVIPSGITDSNIYIKGYRYIGLKGPVSDGSSPFFEDITISGIATVNKFTTGTGTTSISIQGTTISGLSSITITANDDIYIDTNTLYVSGPVESQVYKIDGNEVLSSTSLGLGVTESNLKSVSPELISSKEDLSTNVESLDYILVYDTSSGLLKKSTIIGASLQGLQGLQGLSHQGIQGLQGNIGNPTTVPPNSQSSSYTLALGDVGKYISITSGGVTVPSGVFSAGDIVSIYNNSTLPQTISQGASVTMYLVGTSATGNRTLSQRGLATVLCVGSNEFVISGGGLY